MNKTPFFLLALPLLLISCAGNPGSGSSPSASDGEASSQLGSNDAVKKTITLYRNLTQSDSTVLGELTVNAAGFVEEPLEPVQKGFVFQGWYDAKDGGNPFYFNSVAPKALYAHWRMAADMTDAELVKAYQDKVQRCCPKVGHISANVTTQIQYAIAPDHVFGGTTHTEGYRYSNATILKNYSPNYYPSDADLTPEQIQAGHTAAELNEKNLWSTEQDTLDEENNFYRIVTFNPSNPSYSPENEDYKEVTKLTQDKPDTALNIDFSAFFMGYVNTLYGYLKSNKSMTKVGTIPFDTYGDFYYMAGIDVTTLDPSQVGQNFSYSYLATSTSSSGNSVGTEVMVQGGMAFKDGKIVHCQVEKVLGMYVDGELLMIVTSENTYDFDEVEEYPEYQGTLLNPDDYPFASED